MDYFFSPNLHFTALTKETPHILMIHDLTFQLFKKYYTPRQRLKHRLVKLREQCQRARHIVVPSENTKRDIVDYYRIPETKITVLYPGISASYQRPAATVREEAGVSDIRKKYSLPKRYLLFLGTIEPRKNILGLIEAFERAAARIPTDYSLVIAGAAGWKNAAVRKRLRQSGVKKRLQFIGYIDPIDKPSLYRGAGLFVYPSFYEGFGFPVLEALASGVPTITSNRSSLPEITGSAGYLINPHRSDEIAQGIVHLLTNGTAREHAIKKGLAEAARFSWDSTVKKWLALLAD